MNPLSLVATVVVLTSTLGMAQSPTVTHDGEAKTLTGTVTSTGRITHQYLCQRNQTLQTCTLSSVAQGSHYVLLVGDKPFVLEVSPQKIESYAGGKATVRDVVSNNRIQVLEVSNAGRELASLR
jgi:hypothetical protein